MAGIDTVKPDEKNEGAIASPLELFKQVDRLLKDDTTTGIEKGAPAKFFDASGKPVDNLVGRKEPVIGISVDENGDARVAVYANGQAARERKAPELLVVVSRTKDQDVSKETRRFFEPTKGGDDKPTAVVTSEINKKENTATITAVAGDEKQTVVFKNGLPLSIDQRNSAGGLRCEIGPDGKITKLEIGGKEPDAAKVRAIVEALQMTADLVATENGFPKPPRFSYKDAGTHTLTERPAGDKSTDKVIEVSKLPADQKLAVERTQELQGQLLLLLDKLKFSSDEERAQFKARLKEELGVRAGADSFTTLPRFGEATKEGFKKLVELHEKATLPGMISELQKMQIALPPACPLEVANETPGVVKSTEQFCQEVQRGNGQLKINPERLEDLDKLRRVNDWLEVSSNKLDQARFERLEKYLSRQVEDGIKSGRYPESWRRPENMNVQTWCVAVDKAMASYNRAQQMIELIDHMQKSGKGFKSDALKESELPPGLQIQRDKDGKIVKVSFDERLMISDLSLQSDNNKKKLDAVAAYCDKFEGNARAAMLELIKDQREIPGYGEADVKGGWISPDRKDFVVGHKDKPGPGWEKFNMISYNMKVEKVDATGKIKVSTECSFEEVPWYGYLNAFADVRHTHRSKNPVEYAPDDWVAVQTQPGVDQDSKQLVPGIQLVRARDLADWKEKQALMHYGNKAIIFTMDAAMVVSGGLHVGAALKVAQLGTKEAVALGAGVLKTEVVTQVPSHVVSRALAKGAFEMVLGGTGIFHNAGAHEVPWMSGLSDARAFYFLSHAGYSVGQLLRLDRAAGKVFDAVSPTMTAGIRGTLDTIRGSESTMRALAQAHAGALSKLPHAVEGAEKAAQYAFAISDKAFLAMFSWDMIRLGQKLKERPDQVNQAFKSFRELNANDRTALDRAATGSAVNGDHVGAYLTRFRDTLSSPTANFDPSKLVSDFVVASRLGMNPNDRTNLVDAFKKAYFEKPSPAANAQMDQIIARMAELTGPGAKPEDRKKYAQELIKYLRYDGATIARIQNGRGPAEELSPYELTALSGTDHKNLDPSVRRVAALALLTLTRKPDGAWDETVASRSENVDAYTLVSYDSEGNAHKREVTGKVSHQKVTAKELIELLQGDLRAETNDSVRLEKALAMHESGLVSNEQVADMLLKRIEGVTEQDKGKRLEAIVDLAALMSKVKVAEKISSVMDSSQDKQTRAGLTVGLTHADMLRRLEEITAKTQDKELRSTLLFAQSMMKRDTFDQVDKERMEAAFLKKPPGISEEELARTLRADVNSVPTDKAGWERKFAAADVFCRLAIREGKLDLEAARALKECVKTSSQPTVALRATQTLLESMDGVRLVDRLEKEEPKSWKNFVLGSATDLLLSIDVSKGATPPDKLEAARAKEALIPLLVTAAMENKNSNVIGNVNAVLQVISKREKEGVQEIRAAALRGLAALDIRDADTIKAIVAHLKPDAEPSPMVRLAAVEAFVALTPVAKTRADVLGPLAAAEPDPAVRAALEKYYRAAGDINDAGSQKSEQAVNDKVADHNKSEIKRDETEKWLAANAPALFRNDELFRFFDGSKERVRRWADSVSFNTAWADATRNAAASSLHVGYEHLRSAGRDELVRLELVAQNRAFAAYGRGLDELTAQAMGGSTKIVDKAFFAGQPVSESEAAILALGWLASAPPQLGEQLQGHRVPNPNPNPLAPGPYIYKDYTPEQKRLRDALIDSPEGRKEKLVSFGRDRNPGDQLQILAATKLADLASLSKQNVNLKMVTDQLLSGLKSEASTSDKSRVILVGGLEKLLANPNVSDAEKREIVKKLSVLVADSKEATQDKQKSIVAMTGLLDRYKDVFQPFSKELSDMRTALLARARLDSVNTPPDARMAAQEAYDNQWQSVLGEFSRTRAGNETARNRADMLPKDLAPLEKANRKDGTDEKIHEAVQKIILATKGEPLKAGDPRLKAIEALTDEKYDNRVRMAAMMALSQSTDLAIRERAAETIYTFALTSLEKANGSREGNPSIYGAALQDEIYNRALRNDAFKLLETLPPVKSDTSLDLQDMHSNLSAAVARATGVKPETLAGKSHDELIKLTTDYIKEKAQSDNPADKAHVRELNRRLHLFAEANTLLATQRFKAGDKEGARKLYDTALFAFGLDNAAIDQLTAAAKLNKHVWVHHNYDVQQMGDKLVASVQATGSFPSLLNALTGQARVSASDLSKKDSKLDVLTNDLDKSIGLLSFANVVSGKYHPDQSVSRAEFLNTMGSVYRDIASPSSRIGWADRWNEYAATSFELARTNLEAVRARERRPPGTPSSVDELIARNHQASVLARIEKYRYIARYSKDPASVSRALNDVDQAIEKHPDKASPGYHLQRFLRSRWEADLVPADRKEAAKNKATEALNDLLTTTRKVHGAASKDYAAAVSRVWLFNEDMKQPEKSEEFFKKALAETTNPNQKAERAVLLSQYYNFLTMTPVATANQSPEVTAQQKARKEEQSKKAAAVKVEYQALVAK